jgi:hypothetical protein
MIVIGTDVVEAYFAVHTGHKGIVSARRQYEAWLAIAEAADWKTRADVKRAHPKASILKGAGGLQYQGERFSSGSCGAVCRRSADDPVLRITCGI